MKTPAVSVLMPVYNGERFLAEAIDSILGQTFTDFEFVVIDDGSTDASPAILAEYVARDPRVRIIRQPNAGIVAALNRGLEECHAPLVARMDADDVSLPRRFAAQVRYLTNHPDVVAIGTSFQLMADSGTLGPVIRHPVAPKDVARGLRTANRIAHPTVMMRRDPVLAVGGYREALRHAEDYDLWARLSGAHKLANHPDCLLRYRVHESQVSCEVLELQTIRTVAVGMLGAQRSAVGHDDADNGDPIDRAWLGARGISDAAIDRAIFDTMTGRAALCGSLGMTSTVTMIYSRLSERQAASRTGKLALLAATRRRWALATAHGKNGDYARACIEGMRCVASALRHPAAVATLAGRRLNPLVVR